MNKDIIKGHWQEIKGKIQRKWGQFTDDDLDKMEGSYKELSGEIQKKYGQDKERVEREIDQFLKDNELN